MLCRSVVNFNDTNYPTLAHVSYWLRLTAKSFWVVPAPEAFSRHSGTCRLLGDRKHPPASHTLQVGDFLRVGSVGVVVIETHNGIENRVLSEEKIQKIMKDTTNSNTGFLDLAETDGGT